MITQRGFVVVFGGVLLLTSGFSFINFYLVLLGVYLVIGLVVTLPLFALTANLAGIEVDRQIDKVKVFSGDFLRVRVTIRNVSRRHFDFIEVHDHTLKPGFLLLVRTSLPPELNRVVASPSPTFFKPE